MVTDILFFLYSCKDKRGGASDYGGTYLPYVQLATALVK